MKPKLFKHLSLLKFCIAGFINTSVDFIVFFVAIKLLSISPYAELAGKTIAAIAGITSAFILNSLWVFRRDFFATLRYKHTIWKKAVFIFISYLKMFVTYAAGAIINISIFSQLRTTGMYLPVALVAATLVSMAFNYFFSKRFVFAAQVRS